MNLFRKAYESIRDRVFGRQRDDIPEPTTWGRRVHHRLNEGPADAKYLRRLFPNSIFTKRFTKCRQKNVLMIMRRLRPEQRAIVRARGWNRGIESWTKL